MLRRNTVYVLRNAEKEEKIADVKKGPHGKEETRLCLEDRGTKKKEEQEEKEQVPDV